MSEQNDKKRLKTSSFENEEEHDLPEVKKLRKDLLENFEDFEIWSTNPELDSFIKSFEEEISPENQPPATELPDLGYLLEASDDELGLPPSTASPSHLGDDEVAELVNVSSDSAGSGELGELWGFDDNNIGFDFGVGGTENIDGVGNEYVELDGLFDYSDMGFGSADFV